MSEFKGTKGNFSDGYTGWKVQKITTNEVQGFEIHYSDDGECITDHVYTREDAQLIACAPEMLEMLERVMKINNIAKEHIDENLFLNIEHLIKKATNI